jgi:hypothetical protein
MGQPQSRIAGDPTLSAQYRCNPVGRHIKLSREFGRAHTGNQWFLGKVLAWVNWRHRHGDLLVISDDFDDRRSSRSRRPLETYPPHVVNADAVPTFPAAGKSFKTITWKHRKVIPVELNRVRILRTQFHLAKLL